MKTAPSSDNSIRWQELKNPKNWYRNSTKEAIFGEAKGRREFLGWV